MEVKPNRSSAYRFTVTSKDDPALKALQAEISEQNRSRTWEPANMKGWGRNAGKEMQESRRLTVSLKGRLGKDNPHREKIGRRAVADGSIPHWAAQHFDVYVHERWDCRPIAGQSAPVEPPKPVKGLSHFHADFNVALTELIDGWERRGSWSSEYTIFSDFEINRTINRVLLSKVSGRL